MKNNLIRKLLRVGVVSNGKITLRSGTVSQHYIDVKKAYGEPKLLKDIAVATVKILPKTTTVIAASGYGGLPLASAVAVQKGLRLSLVRESRKKHGTKRDIDGYIPVKKDRVIIIDDVFTTGSSIRMTMRTLRKTKAKIIGACVVVRRTEKKFPIPLSHLFTGRDFLGV